MKRLFLALLIPLALLCCGCERENAPHDVPASSVIQDTPQPQPQAEPEIQTEPEAEPQPEIEIELEKTAAPVINYCHNTEPDLISVGGQCEENAKITLKTDAETVEITAFGEYFLAQVRIPEEDDCILEITACGEGKAPSNAVIEDVCYMEDEYVYGNEWHILTGNTSRCFAKSSFADFEGTNLMSAHKLNAFEMRVRDRVSLLHEALPECELIYLIVPNQLTVYADEAPSSLTPTEDKTRLDQVVAAINRTDAVAIDLRDTMRQHKDDELEPYLHTDSHWSEYGAYLGLCALCDHISDKFPEAKSRPVEDYGFENRLVQGGDAIYYLEMEEGGLQKQTAPFYNPVFTRPVTAERYLSDDTLRMDFYATSSRIHITTGNEALPDCVVFRDSFGIALYEILPERFNNTAYYHMWGYNFDMNYIKQYSPDYVIYVIAERNLDNIIL